MSSNPSNTANVSNAWRHQREHQASAAVPEYEQILKQDANNIDALYGYGLALRDTGNSQGAITNFQKCLELVEAAAAARRPAKNEEEHRVANTPEDDRYMMLTRMLKQRISELKSGK